MYAYPGGAEEISYAYPWLKGTDVLPCLFKSSSEQLGLSIQNLPIFQLDLVCPCKTLKKYTFFVARFFGLVLDKATEYGQLQALTDLTRPDNYMGWPDPIYLDNKLGLSWPGRIRPDFI